MNFESYFGSYNDEYDRRYSVWLELRVEPAQLKEHGQTVNHQPIPEDAVEIAITGTVYDVTGRSDTARSETRFVSGGQVVDSLRNVAGRERLVELWDAWHLNGMVAGCAHQGEAWTCTRPVSRGSRPPLPEFPCNTLNGWPEIRRLFGEHPYPQRGDQCHDCGRNRWDEPTDWCPESGYRFGTQWLYRIPPPEIVDELRSMFGQKVTA